MLSPFDRQLPGGVVVDDFWDTVERGAVLTQNVLLFGFGQFHVHKALVAPGNKMQRLLGSQKGEGQGNPAVRRRGRAQGAEERESRFSAPRISSGQGHIVYSHPLPWGTVPRPNSHQGAGRPPAWDRSHPAMGLPARHLPTLGQRPRPGRNSSPRAPPVPASVPEPAANTAAREPADPETPAPLLVTHGVKYLGLACVGEKGAAGAADET